MMKRFAGTAVLTLCLVLPAMPAQAPSVATGSAARDAATGTARDIATRVAPKHVMQVNDRVGDIVSGKWVVSMGAPLTAASRARLRRAGFGIEWVSGDRLRVVVTSATPQDEAMTALSRASGVDGFEPLGVMHATATPSDPSYGGQWGLPAVGAPVAWETTVGGPSVTVAVIDTGVDLFHAEFANRLTDGYDYVNGDAKAQDDNGHGTHVAGIAAAAMNNGAGGVGVAPSIRIMPVKVLDAAGSGYNTWIGEGIRWAADHGADVINLSLTGGYSSTVAGAVAYAQSLDVLVVAAVGNNGTSSLTYQYPAALSGVIGVSAVDSTWQRPYFSNYGTAVDLTAPGVGILSTMPNGGMGLMNGTSMASPFVAGAAALLRAAQPSLTQVEVAARLAATSTDIGAVGRDTFYGAGLVNVARAVAETDELDDDVPGVVLRSLTATGTLSSLEDTHDVYAVTLVAGQSIDVTLTADAWNEFELSILDADAVHAGDSSGTGAEGDWYPRHARLVARVTGSHYIDVHALSGAGDYSLVYAVGPPDPADNDVPGIASATPAVGTLASGVDDTDVYAVSLDAGDRLSVSLVGDEGTDFDLYLFLPGTPSIFAPNTPVESSELLDYPEEVTYTVKVPGTYYLAVGAYSGSGEYTLAWSIESAPPEPDDDIPGVVMAQPTVTGDLSATGDLDDVYRVELAAGQEMTATLTGEALTDFDLHLYGAGATHIAPPDLPIRSSTGGTSSERVTFTALSEGTYYLDVRAYAGAGGYTLETTGIPDVIPPVITVTGVVDAAVYLSSAVPVVTISGATSSTITMDSRAFVSGTRVSSSGTHTLRVAAEDDAGNSASQTVTFRITSPPPPPPVPDVTPPDITITGIADGEVYTVPVAPVVVISGAVTSTITLDSAPFASGGVVSSAGVHTLRVEARDDVGNTALRTVTFRVAEVPVITIASTSTVLTTFGASWEITGTLESSGTPLAGKAIELWTSSESTGLVRAAVVATTGADGVFSFTVSPEEATYYRTCFVGDADSRASEPSDLVRVTPVAYVGAPSAPSIMYRGKMYTVFGDLMPRHVPGDEAVQLRTYLKVGASWVYRGSVIATASDHLPYSRYTAQVMLPKVGTWRLRAYHPGDATHGAAWALSSDYVTVRDVYVGTPVAPKVMRSSSSYTVHGTLRPKHTSGTYPVRIYMWTKVGKSWVRKGYVNAKASNKSGSTSTLYSRSIRLPRAGRWRLRAYHPADKTHPARWSSGFDYVTVE